MLTVAKFGSGRLRLLLSGAQKNRVAKARCSGEHDPAEPLALSPELIGAFRIDRVWAYTARRVKLDAGDVTVLAVDTANPFQSFTGCCPD